MQFVASPTDVTVGKFFAFSWRLFQSGALGWLLLLIAVSACKEEVEVVLPIGIETPAGIAVALFTSAEIGPAGGTLTSIDGRAILTVPAGALSTPTILSLQPIENTAPLGVSNGYRLIPASQHVAKAVTLTLFYTDEEIDGSTPEALGMAFQNKTGVWAAVGGVLLNKVTHSVSVSITRLGDWALFHSIVIVPNQTAVRPNQFIHLKVNQLPGVQLIQTLRPGNSVPLGKPTVVEAKKTKNWLLNGMDNAGDGLYGRITFTDTSSIYTAPPSPPNPNPVSISVLVTDGLSHPVTLVTNITVGGTNRLVLNGGKFNHQEILFEHCSGEVSSGGNQTKIIASDGISVLQIVFPGYRANVYPFSKDTYFCGIAIALDQNATIPENALQSTSIWADSIFIPADGIVRISSYGPRGGLITGHFSGKLWYLSSEGKVTFVEASGKFSAVRIL